MPDDGLRENAFLISPENNPEVYFGREEFVKGIVEHLLDQVYAGMPIRAVFWGPLRVGKSQLAYNLKFRLEKELNGKIILKYFRCPPLHKRSDFGHFLETMIPAIGKSMILEGLRIIWEAYGAQKNLANIAKSTGLIKTRLSEEDRKTLDLVFTNGHVQALWKWLCGNPLSNSEMEEISVVNKYAPSVKAILFVSEALKVQNIKLLLLIDESERLSAPVGDPRLGFLDGLRELTDESCPIGTIFFTTARTNDDIPSVLSEDPIQGRIGAFNFYPLEPYTEDEINRVILEAVRYFRKKDFDIKQMINKLKHKTKENLEENAYPITNEAIEKLWKLSMELHDVGKIQVISPNIIFKTLSVAIGRVRRLYETQKNLPLVTSEIIEDVMSRPDLISNDFSN